MKKAIIFAIAISLSGTVFANGINSIETKEKSWSYTPEFFLQRDDNGSFVCKNKSGIKGYNEITINELMEYPQKGECANLNGTDLSGAYLRGANLSGADLRGTDLSKTYLRGADLRWTILSDANLKEANLKYASLSDANLNDADLSGADLSGAYLRWADLSGADLSGAVLNEAKYNNKTILPFDDAEAKKRGMIKMK